MPYARILQDLIQCTRGARAALLLDGDGEVVVEAGERDERHRLIAAYQGITLMSLRRLAGRYEWGGVRHVVLRYQEGSLIVRPLRDAYYLLVALSPDAPVAEGLHRTGFAQDLMDREI
jgi:predicted regulator of Ras-like GTPase activity (Roadblock/LC7/MglB family)